MSVICSQPLGSLPPSFRFRLEEIYDDGGGSPETRWLPPVVEYFEDHFILVENNEDFESPASGDLGILSTQGYAKTLELKECFPPVLIRWKHFTKAAGTGITTSTDESVLLEKDSPDYTWPAATDYVSGVTDGEWDADFEMHQTC
jgi:hypothetical protein